MFSDHIKKVVEFCSEQCHRQGVGPLSVNDMFKAYDYLFGYMASSHNTTVTVPLILRLGKYVEPNVNDGGHRKGPVFIKDVEMTNWTNVTHLLLQLCEAQDALSAEEFYWEFERIHPFYDGNGRVGAMLYNLKLNNLLWPVQPPEMVWP